MPRTYRAAAQRQVRRSVAPSGCLGVEQIGVEPHPMIGALPRRAAANAMTHRLRSNNPTTRNKGHTTVCVKPGEAHLDRYVAEFSGRHNRRPLDTEDMMAESVRGMVGKLLTYRTLISEPGEPGQQEFVLA